MQKVKETEQPISKLQKLIREGDIVMLATKTQHGELRSRPMQVCCVTQESRIIFFTRIDAELSEELTEDNFVNISLDRAEQGDYVSVSGVAQINQNLADMESIWQEKFSRWVPDGLYDPTLAMIIISPLHAEHWGTEDHRTSLGRIMDFGNSKPQAVYEEMRDK